MALSLATVLNQSSFKPLPNNPEELIAQTAKDQWHKANTAESGPGSCVAASLLAVSAVTAHGTRSLLA